MFTKREIINELTPIQQLDVRKIPYKHFPDRKFHKSELICDGGQIFINNDVYACDKCGQEEQA